MLSDGLFLSVLRGGCSMIYFDQAASSFPKPIQVADAMYDNIVSNGANPGRGGHQFAKKAAHIIQDTRENVANTFGCSNPKQCLFYVNATTALNQAIHGLNLQEGDHVLTTSYEHNSIRRPLESLKKNKHIEVTHIIGETDEEFIEHMSQSIRTNTKLIAITHASNVTGAMNPIKDVSMIAKRHSIPILIDASQTAGHIPIHMKNDGIDMLAFPGHKGLLGPQGTGVLLVEGNMDLYPLIQGGTGAFSEQPEQPLQWPERLESGTLNTPGIAGLNEAVKLFMKQENKNVPRETLLINKLINGLKKMPDLTLYGPESNDNRLPIMAFNVTNTDSQEIAMVLDSHYNIAVRGGLHCNPLTHHVLGTSEQGAVRISLSQYNTEEEVDQFLSAMKEIVIAYSEL